MTAVWQVLRSSRLWWSLLTLGLVVTVLSFVFRPSFRSIPDPTLNAALVGSGETSEEIAVLAGGCFWGLEAMFEQVRGVKTVLTGYSGGTAATANYPQVSGGGTDHAESIQITYDPSQVSYGELLKIFFSVGHDPTQVNRQGADVGRQYRSAVFATTPGQQAIAQAYLEQLKGSGLFDQPIVTEIDTFQAFYPAEDYHQDFVAHHPAHPYVLVHDIPKLQKFRQAFPDKLKS